MAIWVGTSGYNYPEWKGSFYPEKLPAAKMLPYYAQRLSTVEINYTYYRTPNKKILEGWSLATPERFKLTLKAPKRITHIARLRDCGDLLRYFVETAARLGPKLGALLFQLPPTLKQDLPLLDAFLDMFPADVCAAFEFRHGSWLNEDVFQRLQARNLALCASPTARRWRHRCGSRPTTRTSGCATRGTRRRISRRGHAPSTTRTAGAQGCLRLLQARGRRQRPGVRARTARRTREGLKHVPTPELERGLDFRRDACSTGLLPPRGHVPVLARPRSPRRKLVRRPRVGPRHCSSSTSPNNGGVTAQRRELLEQERQLATLAQHFGRKVFDGTVARDQARGRHAADSIDARDSHPRCRPRAQENPR